MSSEATNPSKFAGLDQSLVETVLEPVVECEQEDVQDVSPAIPAQHSTSSRMKFKGCGIRRNKDTFVHPCNLH